MHLSAENEMLFRRAVGAADKKAEIRKLSDMIEGLEREMATKYNDGYLDVISKCAILEQLQDDIRQARKSSSELYMRIKDVELMQSSFAEEHGSIERSIARAREIQRGLLQIYEFLAEADRAEGLVCGGDGDVEIFEAVSCLEKMKAMKTYLKQFNFYKALSSSYQRLLDAFQGRLREMAERWVDGVDLVEIGRSVDLDDNSGLFDKLLVYRRKIFGGVFLKLVYAFRQTDAESVLVEILNGRMERFLRRARGGAYGARRGGADSVLHFSTAFVLLNSLAAECLPACRPFYDEAFELVQGAEVEDVHALVPLKRAAAALKLNPERLDEIIEHSTFRFFEKKISGDGFLEKLKGFVRDSVRFLGEISDFSSELDDLLAKRVDDLLLGHLTDAKNDTDDATRFAAIQDGATEVLDVLKSKKPLLAAFDFRSIEFIERRNDRFIGEKYSEVVDGISNAASTAEIVEIVVSLRDFMNEKCRRRLVRKVVDNYRDWMGSRSQDDVSLVADTLRRNFPALA